MSSHESPERTKHVRLNFLDALRGFAACLVAFQHIAGASIGSFNNFTANGIQFGQMGVTIFFLCSGFVIPLSIEGKMDLSNFWKHRFFRIFPLYWASLCVAIVGASLGLPPAENGFSQALLKNSLINLTMMQHWLGFPHALEVYWSLSYELIFYALFSFLVITKENHRTALITGILLFGALLIPLAFLALGKRPLAGVGFHFATLFFGTLFYRHFQERIKTSLLAVFLAGVCFVIILVNYFSFYLHPEFSDVEGIRRFVPMTSAWLSAYFVFLLFYSWRARSFSPATLWLGRISYSIYLVHPLVIAYGPKLSTAAGTFTAWAGLTLLISSGTYKYIEQPFIRWSHRIRLLKAASSE